MELNKAAYVTKLHTEKVKYENLIKELDEGNLTPSLQQIYVDGEIGIGETIKGYYQRKVSSLEKEIKDL